MRTDLFDTDGSTTVTVTGEIDLACADELRQTLDRAVTPELRALVIDVSGVSFCDSSGLHVFAHVHETCTRQGVCFRMTGARPILRRLFSVTGLDELLEDAHSF